MEHFTLIGRPTLVFRVTWRGEYAGIDCVRGLTLDGKSETLARAADVVFCSPAPKPAIVITRRRAYFSRCGYTAEVWLNAQRLDILNFYGADGRKVRAEAKAWAKRMLAKAGAQ